MNAPIAPIRGANADISEADRFREIARILATGILRLHARSALTTEPDATEKNLPNIPQDCLAISDEIVPCVTRVNGFGDLPRSKS
jgi:hypothetical protein